jgi:hypothetical protein
MNLKHSRTSIWIRLIAAGTQPQQPSAQDTHHRPGVALDGDASPRAAAVSKTDL